LTATFKVKASPSAYQKIKLKDFSSSAIWYAYIVGPHPATGKQVQIRYKKDVNRIADLAERQHFLSCLVEVLEEKLQAGWCPVSNQYPTSSQINHSSLLSDSLQFFLDIKKTSLRPRSVVSYTSRINIFKDWLNVSSLQYISLGKFTQEHAQKYMDYLSSVRKNKPKTFNNNLLDMRTVFNFYIDREVLDKNPFKKIKRLQVERGKNNTYTQEEADKIDLHLKANNIRLYYFKEFIYCAAIRRTELTKIRINDILDSTIVLRSEISKNKVQESVVINKRLKQIIISMQLDKHPADSYLFGRGLRTCEHVLANPNQISTQHQKVLEKLEIRSECNLYSWKHTGAVNLYNKTKDAYITMRHLRHKEVSTTMIYLRSLGVVADENLKDLDW
jgi:integrase